MVGGGDSDGSVDADATTKASRCTGGLARRTPPVTPTPSPGAHGGAVESGYDVYLAASSDARVKLIDGFRPPRHDLPHILASSWTSPVRPPRWATLMCPPRTRTTTRSAGTLIAVSCSASADGTFRPNASVQPCAAGNLPVPRGWSLRRERTGCFAVQRRSGQPPRVPRRFSWLSQKGINGSDFPPLRPSPSPPWLSSCTVQLAPPAQAQGRLRVPGSGVGRLQRYRYRLHLFGCGHPLRYGWLPVHLRELKLAL